MTSDDEKYRAIIDHYGEPAQVLKAIEEMAELTQSLTFLTLPLDQKTCGELNSVYFHANEIKNIVKMCIDCNMLGYSKQTNHDAAKSECADVENMLSQLRIIFGSWEDKRVEKLDRTMERIRK